MKIEEKKEQEGDDSVLVPASMSAWLDGQCGGPRSLGRRKIEIFLHALERQQFEARRCQIIMDGIVCERSIAQLIMQREIEVIKHQTSKGIDIDCSLAMSELARAESEKDITTVVLLLQRSVYMHIPQVQEAAILALNRLSVGKHASRNRSQIVNAGGIQAITTSMKIHLEAAAATVNGRRNYLRIAATVLIRLPFFSSYEQQQWTTTVQTKDGGISNNLGSLQRCSFVDSNGQPQSVAPDIVTTSRSSSRYCSSQRSWYNNVNRGGGRRGSSSHSSNSKRHHSANEDCVDFGVVELLLESGALDILSKCSEGNHLFDATEDNGDDDDLIGSFERKLASEQLPVVIQNILKSIDGSSPGVTASSKTRKQQSMTLHRKRWLFLRSCLASLLDDTTITQDTLKSIVL